MAQMMYSLMAIALIMMLSFTFVRNITATQQKMALNEVATQVSGVSMEILDHIGQRYFDKATNPKYVFPKPPPYPYITGEDQLTTQNGDDWGVNGSLCPQGILYDVISCDDIDDYDGMIIARDVDGLTYEATVSVQYVNTCTLQPSGKSYGKEVTLTITSPDLRLGNDPLTVTVSRVFTYNRITCTHPAGCPVGLCSPS